MRRRRLWGLVVVTHPLPSLMYVLAVGLFGALAASASHHAVNAGTMVRVLLGVWCAQMAIGALNDYMDRAHDAVSQPEKPIVRGDVTPGAALIIVVLASILVIVLLAPLGPLALGLGLLVEALGLAYDLRFKGTWVSGLLYAVYFPLIPILAWTVFGRFQPFLPWLLVLGAPLGIGMNVANSLPDLEADLAAGVRGLPHLLGLRTGLVVSWLTPPLVAAVMVLLAGTGAVPARPAPLVIAVALAVGSSAVAWLLTRGNLSRTKRQEMFYVQALGVVGMAAAWLAAVAFS